MAKKPTRTTTTRAKPAAGRAKTARTSTAKTAAAKAPRTVAAKAAKTAAAKSAAAKSAKPRATSRAKAKAGKSSAVQISSGNAVQAAQARAALAASSLSSLEVRGLSVAERSLGLDPSSLTPIGNTPIVKIPDSALPVRLRPDAFEASYWATADYIRVVMPDALPLADANTSLEFAYYQLPHIKFGFEDFVVQSTDQSDLSIEGLVYVFDDALAGATAAGYNFGANLITVLPFARMTPMLDMLRIDKTPSIHLTFAMDGQEVELISCHIACSVALD